MEPQVFFLGQPLKLSKPNQYTIQVNVPAHTAITPQLLNEFKALIHEFYPQLLITHYNKDKKPIYTSIRISKEK